MEIKNRNEIKDIYKWDIEKIFKNSKAWEDEFSSLKEDALKLRDYNGKLNNPKTLIEYLKLDEEISRRTENLFVYAHLKSDEDTSNNENQGRMNKIDSYVAELSSYTSFFVPEVLELGEEFINKAIEENSELKIYSFMFENILDAKEHTLTKEVEELLAGVSDCLEAPSSIQGILSNADMSFPKIKNEEGKEVELSEANYSSFIKSKDINVRREAFKKLFGQYDKLKNTFATSLSSSLKNYIFIAKTRKYKDSLDMALSPNKIPASVYEGAIKTINDNIESLHRYVRIKKKLLNLDEIHMYDLYVPVVEVPKEEIEFNDGVNLVLDSLKPLGNEYLEIFKEGIKNRWIDIYPNKGKRGGAYSWGCYDTMPYVLLNYTNELNDVSTLAHEMGHSIHSYYSRMEQPYFYAGYTIFCAEIASTTNEKLLINRLIENEKNKEKKLYLINQELEQIRTTVFRQLMFAEFELWAHREMESGNPLTAEEFCNKWLELNKNYFGEDIILDDEIKVEWARIPHFYSDFYVYQYATGYAAASAFANSILNNEENAVEKYKGFLKSGGSNHPIDILKKAGVDMTSSKPIEATIERFNSLLDMLEEM